MNLPESKSIEEQWKLLEEARAGNADSRAELICANLRYAYKCAKRSSSQPDFISIAFLATVQAVDFLIQNKNAELKSIKTRIIGAIKRGIRKGVIVNVPEKDWQNGIRVECKVLTGNEANLGILSERRRSELNPEFREITELCVTSNAERMVLTLLMEGTTRKEIAKTLGVSEATVYNIRAKIKERFIERIFK